MSLRSDKTTLTKDLVAGLTFAMVNIPQSMAHALLAAVNPVFGLYTLMLATPVGALFTGAVFMNVSTTSALAVATGGALVNLPASNREAALATLVLLIGIFQIIMGLLKLGWVTHFIPFSVMTGFMTGVATIIIIGQLGDFTGFYSLEKNKVRQLADLILNMNSVQWAAMAIGLFTILIIYLLSRTRLHKFSFIIALLAASILAAILNQVFQADVKLVNDITDVPSMLPKLALPEPKLIARLILPAISIGIIGLVQGAGVSQTFPNPDGKFSNVSRDFFGQGMANLATSLVRGIPAGGSSSGTAVVVSAGARSRWANIFAGVFVALIVLLLSNQVEKIAMPALAGLVIVAGVQMINVNNIRTVWQTNSIARLMMLITFGSTLVMPLQYAVFLGVALSIVLSIFQQSNALRIVEWDPQEYGWPVERPAPRQLISNKVTALYIYGNLFYATAANFEKSLPAVDDAKRAGVILLLRGFEDVGSTVMGVLNRYTHDLQSQGGQLFLAGVSAHLHDQLERTGLLALIGGDHVFPATETIGESANAALRAAHNWLAAAPADDSNQPSEDQP